ncbi:hypothetical protein EYF80_009104 [Liparis tanakae]|uniref:Uncharacterized protein n=1 Tax=Liparis tanakae TaxID=230148 RepID=A0A4Z2ISL9_9TELE|nr:hypothetical protein EYF80_009104 [Liparis tanakae]
MGGPAGGTMGKTLSSLFTLAVMEEDQLTVFAAFDGDLLVGFCTWPLSVTGCLDTEPFSRFLLGEDGTDDGGGVGEAGGGEEVEEEEDGCPTVRTAISCVAVRRRLRRPSCVSWSTTSNRVSSSRALIRCTT